MFAVGLSSLARSRIRNRCTPRTPANARAADRGFSLRVVEESQKGGNVCGLRVNDGDLCQMLGVHREVMLVRSQRIVGKALLDPQVLQKAMDPFFVRHAAPDAG